ncbi:flippase [Candidatus Saccharibacteria bacterium]|nr:flippase [Candidatus Saccharibacteria bacterium]
MQNKLAKNYIYTLVYQILVIILPIITMPYLSRVLGAENIGIYGYTISIVSWFTLVCGFGITKYGQREIAYAQKDREKRSAIFWELCLIKFVSVILFSIIFFLFFCIGQEYANYYKVLLLEIVAVFFDITWFFQGIEDFRKVVVRNSIVKIISILAIFVFVKNESDLMNYFLIYVASNFIGNVTLWIKIGKYVDKPNFKFVKLKKHVKPMFSLFIPQVAISIYTILDKTMLGSMVSDISEVGYYEQSQKIIKIALTIVTALSVVMMPRISHTYANNDKEKVDKYMNMSFRFDWFMGVAIAVGIAAIAPTFVPWFFGAGFDKVATLLVWTSPVIIAIAFSSTIGSQYLVSVRKQSVQTVAVVIGAIVNVSLNLLLIPHLESVGAIIATVVAELIITAVEIIYIVKHKYSKIPNIFASWYVYIFVGALMFVVVRLLQNFMDTGMISTAIQILLGGAVYCLVLLVIRDDFMHLAIGVGVKLIKKKK